MVYRHSFMTRITHATFSFSFLALAFSGALIYFHARWLHINVTLVHEYLGLAMLTSGTVYIGSSIVGGQIRRLLFGARDLAGIVPMLAYYLRARPTPPPYDGYNPLQKLAYTLVLFMLGPLIVLSGLALWKHAPPLHHLSVLFGGRATKTWHLVFTIELALFFLVHMVMIAATGLRNNLRAIVTGWHASSPSEAAFGP